MPKLSKPDPKRFAVSLTASLALTGLYSYYFKDQSLSSFLLDKTLRLVDAKQISRRMAKSDHFKSDLIKNNELPLTIPKTLLDYPVKEYLINDMQVFSWNKKSDDQPVIFFLHGGGYVFEPNIFHWQFINRITKLTDAHVVMPIYFKATQASFETSFKPVITCYQMLRNRLANPDRIFFLGDSAGGGFVLGLAEYLIENELEQPTGYLAISPWLDIRLDNEEISSYEQADPLLDPEATRYAGSYWLDPEADNNAYVSPLYMTVDQLRPVFLTTGTKEILYPDIVHFAKRLSDHQIDHQLVTGHQQIHDYAILMTPEGRSAQNKMQQFINQLLNNKS